MNILNKISITNLKLNKKRTIVTIIGIILSVALICAVAGMGESFRATLLEGTINQLGYYHMNINDITEDDFISLKINRDISDVMKTYNVGSTKVLPEDYEEEFDLNIYSFGSKELTNLAYKLESGVYPKNDKEIVIGKSTALVLGYRLNDVVTLDVLNKDNTVSKNTYRIVGIVNRSHVYGELYAITTGVETNSINAYLSLKNPRDYKKTLPHIVGLDKYEELTAPTDKVKYSNFNVNEEILRWEVFAFSDTTIQTLLTVMSVVIIIILVTSIFCIRNSIAIATTEKIKMYGMLASVGATKKQIKKSVIYEALLLGIVGIPLGVLCGYFAVFVLVNVINLIAPAGLIGSSNGLVFSLSLVPVIVSSLLGFLTIYLSSLASARKAGKVSPIAQLRNSQEIKIKAKKLHTPKIISKFFKTGGVLAYKNLKRSKKKYRTTVVSLAISVMAFISMNTFISETYTVFGTYYQEFDYNLGIFEISEFNPETIESIRNIEGAKDSSLLFESRSSNLTIYDKNKVVDSINMDPNECNEYNKNPKCGTPSISMTILGLDTHDFNKYLKKLNLDKKGFTNEAILADYYNVYEDDKIIEKRLYNYKKGDTIEGFYNNEEMNLNIGAISKIKPEGRESYYTFGGYIVVNKDYHPEIDFVMDRLTMDVEDAYKAEESIKDITKEGDIFNLEEVNKSNHAMLMIISIFLYGFIAVVTLIGVTNIFNTITANMELRQKEFAMLKSVGMTKKEFKRMINLETIFYSTKALLYGIVLGSLGSYFIHYAYGAKIFSSYSFPWVATIISILAVFLLVFFIMKYSISKINKQNIIETIRRDNI